MVVVRMGFGWWIDKNRRIQRVVKPESMHGVYVKMLNKLDPNWAIRFGQQSAPASALSRR